MQKHLHSVSGVQQCFQTAGTGNTGVCSMDYYYPGKQFPAISVTGKRCEMKCLHCQGQYLQSMIPAETPDELVRVCLTLDKTAAGCLISGGCDASGQVPLPFDALNQIRDETDLILNLHTGLVTESTAEELLHVSPHYISLEVPTPYVLTQVYQPPVPICQKEYFESLSLLDQLQVVPHVMVGLEHNGERETLRTLHEIGSSSLVLIVFTPTKGTPLEKKSVDCEEVIKTFELARELFPRLVLGCMRPRVKMIEEKAGLFDGIVIPTRWAKEQVEKAGLPVRIKETCCVVQ